MRQCPDCEEKDRVVIAGKVFCANCGTPWQPTDAAEENPYLTKVGILKDAPKPEEAPPVTLPATPSTPAPAPVATPATPTPPAPAPPVAVPPVVPTPAAPATEAPKPKLAEAYVAPAQPAAPAAPVGSSPVTPLIPPKPSTPVFKEEIGSEIPSLDSQDESVLSDSEFQAMSNDKPATATPPPVNAEAQAVPAPTPAPAPVPAPVVPTPAPEAAPAPPPPGPAPAPTPPAPLVVTPAASIPVSTPPAPAPAQVVNNGGSIDGIAAPTANITLPTTPPPAPAPVVENTTVEGVTMSREAALKLALGEDAAAGSVMQPAPGPARPLAVVLSVIGLVMLGAYFWQANYPAVALKLAGMKSGINVAVPAYLPTGWSISREVTSSDGSISYKVSKNDQAFKVTETNTSWDSQALLEQYVIPKSKDYLALQAEGLTIYVYGDNQAVWVANGTLHKLEGNHGLSQDEIIRIATSL